MSADEYRDEGFELEQQEKYEEAFLKYEEAAKMNDTLAMIYIARMYLSGNFRPAAYSNFAELLQRGAIFPWSLRDENRPDYESGFEWVKKAADNGNALACELAGDMLCNGIGCMEDVEEGISYLEKAAANGHDSARKSIYLYRPDGKILTDKEYESCLAEFAKAADAGNDKAYELYATLKSGTQKQLARLGHILITAQNVQKSGYNDFKYSLSPSGIPLLPVVSKRANWCTFLRFNLNAWLEEHPLIAIAADILNVNRPSRILSNLHHARIVGTVAYKSPEFGWLGEEKNAVLIRLGEDASLSSEALEKVATSFALTDEEYKDKSIAFMVENGEKEYSLEVAGIMGDKVEVLWRYTIGGGDSVDNYFEPELISLNME